MQNNGGWSWRPWNGSIHHSTNLFNKETLEKNCFHSTFTFILQLPRNVCLKRQCWEAFKSQFTFVLFRSMFNIKSLFAIISIGKKFALVSEGKQGYFQIKSSMTDFFLLLNFSSGHQYRFYMMKTRKTHNHDYFLILRCDDSRYF